VGMTLCEVIQDQFAARLDQAVQDVFATMLGVECSVVDTLAASPGQESISVLIGLAGVISGSCMLHADRSSSRRIAGLLTGMDSAGEDTVKDALGEVCNMVAGTWKRCIPELASLCMLSPPTVISGSDYSLHSMPGDLRMQRCYTITNHENRAAFAFMLHCTDGQQGLERT